MKIEIKDLTFKCIIGILDFEREKRQRVIIDISFEYDYEKENFIDYAEVASLVRTLIKKKKFELLEEAILFLEKELYSLHKIYNLKIKITKPDILKNCLVSLSN